MRRDFGRPAQWPSPFGYFKTSPEITRRPVMFCVRFPLSLRGVEDLVRKRGNQISRETVRNWWNRLGPILAAAIRRWRVKRLSQRRNWKWP